MTIERGYFRVWLDLNTRQFVPDCKLTPFTTWLPWSPNYDFRLKIKFFELFFFSFQGQNSANEDENTPQKRVEKIFDQVIHSLLEYAFFHFQENKRTFLTNYSFCKFWMYLKKKSFNFRWTKITTTSWPWKSLRKAARRIPGLFRLFR